MRLHASAEKHAEGAGLRLQAALSWEGREKELLRQLWLPAAHCHPIGTHVPVSLPGRARSAGVTSRRQGGALETTRPALDEVGRESRAKVTQVRRYLLSSLPRPSTRRRITTHRLTRHRVNGCVPPPPYRNCPRVWAGAYPLGRATRCRLESLISAGPCIFPAAEPPRPEEYLPALSRFYSLANPDPALGLPRGSRRIWCLTSALTSRYATTHS